MSKIIPDQLRAILELLKKTVKITQRIEQVQDQDREDYRDLINRVGHLEVEVKSLRDSVNKTPKLIEENVTEAVKPLEAETHDLRKAIQDKKTLPLVVTPQSKKSWFKTIIRR